MKRVDPKGRNWEFGIEHWSIIFVALCSLVPVVPAIRHQQLRNGAGDPL